VKDNQTLRYVSIYESMSFVESKSDGVLDDAIDPLEERREVGYAGVNLGELGDYGLADEAGDEDFRARSRTRSVSFGDLPDIPRGDDEVRYAKSADEVLLPIRKAATFFQSPVLEPQSPGFLEQEEALKELVLSKVKEARIHSLSSRDFKNMIAEMRDVFSKITDPAVRTAMEDTLRGEAQKQFLPIKEDTKIVAEEPSSLITGVSKKTKRGDIGALQNAISEAGNTLRYLKRNRYTQKSFEKDMKEKTEKKEEADFNIKNLEKEIIRVEREDIDNAIRETQDSQQEVDYYQQELQRGGDEILDISSKINRVKDEIVKSLNERGKDSIFTKTLDIKKKAQEKLVSLFSPPAVGKGSKKKKAKKEQSLSPADQKEIDLRRELENLKLTSDNLRENYRGNEEALVEANNRLQESIINHEGKKLELQRLIDNLELQRRKSRYLTEDMNSERVFFQNQDSTSKINSNAASIRMASAIERFNKLSRDLNLKDDRGDKVLFSSKLSPFRELYKSFLEMNNYFDNIKDVNYDFNYRTAPRVAKRRYAELADDVLRKKEDDNHYARGVNEILSPVISEMKEKGGYTLVRNKTNIEAIVHPQRITREEVYALAQTLKTSGGPVYRHHPEEEIYVSRLSLSEIINIILKDISNSPRELIHYEMSHKSELGAGLAMALDEELSKRKERVSRKRFSSTQSRKKNRR